MDQITLDFFKNLLLTNLNDSEREIRSNIKIVSDLGCIPDGDDVDRFNSDSTNLLLLKIKGRQNFYTKKIVDALNRIKDSTFGICEECGERIELSRLMCRPTATKCINCKEEEERTEQHIPYQKRSHTHGKSLINDDLEALINT